MEDATYTSQQVVKLWSTAVTDPRLTAADVRVYATICVLAETSRELTLPGQRAMADLCRLNYTTIANAYRTLMATGWIEQYAAEPGRPWRIRMNLPAAVDAYTARSVELTAGAALHNIHLPEATGLSQSGTPPVAPPQTAPPFPDSLHQLARAIRLSVNGKLRSLPSDTTLWQLSGQAPMSDIHEALLVLRRYHEKQQPVSRIISLWESLFEHGRFIMKRAVGTKFSLQSPPEIPASLVAERLQAAKDLAAGHTIEIGKLHPEIRQRLMDRDAIECRGPHATLKVGFELVLDERRRMARVDQITTDSSDFQTSGIPHQKEGDDGTAAGRTEPGAPVAEHHDGTSREVGR